MDHFNHAPEAASHTWTGKDYLNVVVIGLFVLKAMNTMHTLRNAWTESPGDRTKTSPEEVEDESEEPRPEENRHIHGMLDVLTVATVALQLTAQLRSFFKSPWH